MKLVECVPNFSEGRDRGVIDAIVAAIASEEGVHVLDVDPGRDTNRTVVTFVAPLEKAVDAAFRGIAMAAQKIDMASHHGAHPRMGATDVCPFVPLGTTTMDECVALAKQLGERVGSQLKIPVYLYEFAATREERRNLATIRAGEYEGLADKLKGGDGKPDFGAAAFNARSGATVIGARKFLIAYNVNLNTRDKKKASDIAFSIRESGRKKRDEHGRFVRDMNGDFVYQAGTLKACKAVGWYIDEYQRAQISINLTDFDVTPPHAAFDEVAKQAGQRGLRATGSELVGLIPLEAILRAGRHYLDRQGSSQGVPESEVIETAIQSLGLRELGEFDPAQKIIEYRVAKATPLVSSTLRAFVDVTSTDAPVPGGGSVAALCGALAGALTAMVANLTFGKKDYKDVWEEMSVVAAKAQTQKDAFLRAVDDDARAFDAVMSAHRLPQSSPDEESARDVAIQDATHLAIDVPLSVMRACEKTVPLVARVAEAGNTNSISDAGVAASALRTAVEGAWLNVLINLPGVTDPDYARTTRVEGKKLLDAVVKKCQLIHGQVESGLH
jgi:glutamate formiminotransferase/formiminotetrahydrofolate cyclodeaminase